MQSSTDGLLSALVYLDHPLLPALDEPFNPTALAIGPDNTLYVADSTNHYVYKVTPGVVKDIPFGVDNIVIPSEDGNELYEFDEKKWGQVLRSSMIMLDCKT